VLGDQAESSFRQAILGSGGDLSIFWSNWLVGSITGLSMIMLFWPLISKGIKLLRRRPPPAPDLPASAPG
jgi:putative tricarboxylic transport membrane protein